MGDAWNGKEKKKRKGEGGLAGVGISGSKREQKEARETDPEKFC